MIKLTVRQIIDCFPYGVDYANLFSSAQTKNTMHGEAQNFWEKIWLDLAINREKVSSAIK